MYPLGVPVPGAERLRIGGEQALLFVNSKYKKESSTGCRQWRKELFRVTAGWEIEGDLNSYGYHITSNACEADWVRVTFALSHFFFFLHTYLNM